MKPFLVFLNMYRQKLNIRQNIKGIAKTRSITCMKKKATICMLTLDQGLLTDQGVDALLRVMIKDQDLKTKGRVKRRRRRRSTRKKREAKQCIV